MNRFFRTTSETLYTTVRTALDVAWGHPGPKAETCMPQVEDAPTDSEGRKYVAVLTDMFAWPSVAIMVDPLLQSGQVEEITENEYFANLPQHTSNP